MRDLSLFKHLNAGSLVTVTCGLGLLYVGRDVLEPIALASILSLVIAPLIRSMRRAGLPQLPATVLSVLLAATCSGTRAGPSSTRPSGAKRLPWHAQSQLVSAPFHLISQPMCEHLPATAVNWPSWPR